MTVDPIAYTEKYHENVSAPETARTPVEAGPVLARERHHALNAEDGTRQLLVSGFGIAGVAALAALLTLTVFGGVGPQGPHTNAGWLSLMVCMMSMPFGLLLLLLGGAKWLRNLRLANSQNRESDSPRQ